MMDTAALVAALIEDHEHHALSRPHLVADLPAAGNRGRRDVRAAASHVRTVGGDGDRRREPVGHGFGEGPAPIYSPDRDQLNPRRHRWGFLNDLS